MFDYEKYMQSAEARRREIITLLMAGKTQVEIAEKFGVTKQRIGAIWKRYGPPIARSRDLRFKQSGESKERNGKSGTARIRR